jgi:hypothetical protein
MMARFCIIFILISMSASADSYLVIASKSEDTPPKWVGLTDFSRLPADSRRILHLEITSAPALVTLPPGRYALDHFDFTDTIVGDNRTIRLAQRPEIHIQDNVVRYFGDILVSKGNIRTMINWDTIDTLCRQHAQLLADLPLVTGGPDEPTRTITDVCDSVNL